MKNFIWKDHFKVWAVFLILFSLMGLYVYLVHLFGAWVLIGLIALIMLGCLPIAYLKILDGFRNNDVDES